MLTLIIHFCCVAMGYKFCSHGTGHMLLILPFLPEAFLGKLPPPTHTFPISFLLAFLLPALPVICLAMQNQKASFLQTTLNMDSAGPQRPHSFAKVY